MAIPSSVHPVFIGGHLGCFWFGVIIHKTAINIYVKIFFTDMGIISLGKISGSRIAGPQGSVFHLPLL